jgi:hypothetical protein
VQYLDASRMSKLSVSEHCMDAGRMSKLYNSLCSVWMLAGCLNYNSLCSVWMLAGCLIWTTRRTSWTSSVTLSPDRSRGSLHTSSCKSGNTTMRTVSHIFFAFSVSFPRIVSWDFDNLRGVSFRNIGNRKLTGKRTWLCNLTFCRLFKSIFSCNLANQNSLESTV